MRFQTKRKRFVGLPVIPAGWSFPPRGKPTRSEIL